jgi:hypothetical protein
MHSIAHLPTSAWEQVKGGDILRSARSEYTSDQWRDVDGVVLGVRKRGKHYIHVVMECLRIEVVEKPEPERGLSRAQARELSDPALIPTREDVREAYALAQRYATTIWTLLHELAAQLDAVQVEAYHASVQAFVDDLVAGKPRECSVALIMPELSG